MPVFRSAVDRWMRLVLWLLGLYAVGASIAGAVIWEANREAAVACLLSGLLMGGILFALVVPVEYALTADALVIRSGLLRSTVPLAKITIVRPSRSLWSAPALSMNRLRIDYGKKKWTLVSPADRSGFVAALLAADPGLRMRDSQTIVRDES
jgi:hypothetical protein